MIKAIALMLACLALFAPGALAEWEDGENDGEAVYEMRTEEGVAITRRAGRMYEGDEYISGDNQLYRIVSVDDGARVAIAEHLGEEPAANVGAFRAAFAAEENDDGENKIAMYSTHSDESYVPTDGASSLEENAGIYDVGNALKKNLEALGIEVVYSDATHLPHDAGAYRRSRRTAEELLKDSPDALIDIHRDGIPDSSEYETEVEGEETSKVRLLVGRSNPNADANREFAKELKAAADEMYPGLIKDIFVGKGNYNQELYPQAILLEFGTHTIDKELAISATERMAKVIDETVFGGSAKAAGENERETGAGFKGIWWLIGAAVLAAIIYALVSTGKWKLIGEKFSRSASEVTGGTLGKKPDDEDKP